MAPEGGWQVLLLQTNRRRGDFWQNITGHVERGESFSQAAVRELAEETSWSKVRNIQPLGLSFEFCCQRTARPYREECFLALLTAPATPHIDAREHQQFRWHSTQQMVPSHYRYASNFEAYEKALDVLAIL